MIDPATTSLPGHAQDAIHYALAAACDGSSTFYGDRSFAHDVRSYGFKVTEKGFAACALFLALTYASRAAIGHSIRRSPRRMTLAEIKEAGRTLAAEIKEAGRLQGWDCYRDCRWDADSQ